MYCPLKFSGIPMDEILEQDECQCEEQECAWFIGRRMEEPICAITWIAWRKTPKNVN